VPSSGSLPTNPLLKCVTAALTVAPTQVDGKASYPALFARDQYTLAPEEPELVVENATVTGLANVNPSGANRYSGEEET
jgi:hypothetical protein